MTTKDQKTNLASDQEIEIRTNLGKKRIVVDPEKWHVQRLRNLLNEQKNNSK